MIVVADASPLNYLIQIESDGILQSLFGRVFIPTAVMEELRDARAPKQIKSWVADFPGWLDQRELLNSLVYYEVSLSIHLSFQGVRPC